jgi:hypothetical protein
MRLYQAILLTIVILGALIFYVPGEIAEAIGNLIILISVVWIYKSAKKIEIEKYKSNLSMSPLAYAAWTVFLWPIFFPGYLGLRWRIKNGKQPLKDSIKGKLDK